MYLCFTFRNRRKSFTFLNSSIVSISTFLNSCTIFSSLFCIPLTFVPWITNCFVLVWGGFVKHLVLLLFYFSWEECSLRWIKYDFRWPDCHSECFIIIPSVYPPHLVVISVKVCIICFKLCFELHVFNFSFSKIWRTK